MPQGFELVRWKLRSSTRSSPGATWSPQGTTRELPGYFLALALYLRFLCLERFNRTFAKPPGGLMGGP